MSMHGHIEHNQEYANEQGGWTNTDSRDILGLVALIIYMNVVKVPRLDDCRSTARLFGTWNVATVSDFITKICNLMTQTV